MSWLSTEMLLLDAGRSAVGFAANLLLQSGVLIAIGMAVGRVIRPRGSAGQSAVYRTTMIALLVCPLASWLLALAGVSGWSLQMPAAWTTKQPEELPQFAALLAPRVEDIAADQESMRPANEPVAVQRATSQRSADAGGWSAPPNPLSTPGLEGTTADNRTGGDSQPVGLPGTASLPAESPTLIVHAFGAFSIGISLFWLAASIGLVVRLALAWWRLARLRRGALAAEPHTMEACREVAARLQVSAPDVLHSPRFASPCLTGLLRPAVLLPDTDLNLPIRDVLLHELAHLRRRDCHWNLLSQLALALFFYQPLLWWLTRRLEATAEEVCDDYVVQFGGNREEYAHRLVDIAELSCGPLSAAGVGMVSLRSMLARRVVRILDRSRSLSTQIGGFLLSLVVAGGVVGTIAVSFVGIGESRPVAAVEPPPSDGKKTQAIEPSKASERDGKGQVVPNSSSEVDAGKESAITSELRGRVMGATGKPVTGAKLYWFLSRVHNTEPIKPRLVATTDAAGQFQFTPPPESVVDSDEPAGWNCRQELVVTAPGHGFATTSPDQLRREMPPNNLLGALAKAFTGNTQATIRLPAAGDSIRGQLLDIDGQPIKGATVRIRWFDDIDSPRIRQRMNSQAGDKVAGWRAAVSSLRSVIEPVQLREVLPMVTTNATGHFELRDLGANRLLQLLVQGERIESAELIVRNQSGDAVVIDPDRNVGGGALTVHPREFLQAVGPSNPIVGRVLDFDTDKPIAGAIVRAVMVEGSRLGSSREREEFAVRTDAEGRYRITGLPIGKGNKVVAFTIDDLPYMPAGFQIDTSKGESTKQDFRLKQGLWAVGRVFDAATDKPFTGELSYYRFRDRNLEQAIPGLFNAYVDGCYWTNSKGEFRVPVQPSRGILAFRYDGPPGERDGIDRFPRGYGAESISGSENIGALPAFPTLPHYMHASNYERVAEVHPQSGQASIRVDMPLVAGSPVKVRVVDAEGKPVAGYEVYGANKRWGWRSKEDSQFEIEGLSSGERRKVFVFHRSRNLAGGAIAKAQTDQVIEIKLSEAGSVTGRLVGGDGEPITDAHLFPDYDKLQTDDDAGIWANHPKLIANPTNIPVDDKGRFVVEGLIPGWAYNAHASAPRKYQGQVMNRGIGDPFQGVHVNPGEKKDLGDLVLRDEESLASPAAEAEDSVVNAAAGGRRIVGRVTDADGRPVAGAHVAALGWRTQPKRGGDLRSGGEVLADGTTHADGRFHLTLAGISSKTHQYANFIARKEGAAISWQPLNLDAKESDVSLKLSPEEPIRGRLIDIESLPAADVRLQVRSVMRKSGTDSPGDGVGYHAEESPAAWIAPTLTDKQGNFTIHGVPAGHGVFLDVAGSDRFAPQDIALNTGMPEQRGEHDGTYRSLVRNTKPGEEAVLALAPAQPFEGVVRFGDTGEPAPHARLTIWASQQQFAGSMVSVPGQADAQGRYRISPRPGIRFGVTAYPPDGAPYLVRQTVDEIRWGAGDRVKIVDLALPRGVLVQGKVMEANTGKSVAGASIQYVPESVNNSGDGKGILTGWQAIQVSDQDGLFQIVVLPGPGRLLAHSASGSYVLQEIGERQLSQGNPGGQRNYAHAIRELDPSPDAKSIDVTIELQPGATLAGRIVDEQGESVEEALVITRLIVSPLSLWWRGHMPSVLGGRFDLTGLKDGVEYPTYFLDAKRRLGATVRFKAGELEPTVTLHPCGSAFFRIVDGKGQPVSDFTPSVEMVVTPGPYRYDRSAAEIELLAADADFIANVDRRNYPTILKTNQEGKATLPVLIPGASYRIVARKQEKWKVAKEFVVQTGERLDLGDIAVDRAE